MWVTDPGPHGRAWGPLEDQEGWHRCLTSHTPASRGCTLTTGISLLPGLLVLHPGPDGCHCHPEFLRHAAGGRPRGPRLRGWTVARPFPAGVSAVTAGGCWDMRAAGRGRTAEALLPSLWLLHLQSDAPGVRRSRWPAGTELNTLNTASAGEKNRTGRKGCPRAPCTVKTAPLRDDTRTRAGACSVPAGSFVLYY